MHAGDGNNLPYRNTTAVN